MQRTKKKMPEISRDTEVKLMNAAQNAFIKYGLEGARMQDIADEAGMSKSMLHYYFSKKEKLFETILRRRSPISSAGSGRSWIRTMRYSRRSTGFRTSL